MKKINYKLIVSDFDGTLLTSDNTIPERVKSAINEYVSAGGIFAVCTGRMLRSILPRIKELGLKGLVVAYQGSVIAEIESGKIIKNSNWTCAQSVEVCRYLEELNCPFNIYAGDDLYSNIQKDDEHLILYENITGVQTQYIGKLSDFVLAQNLCCHKAAVLVRPEERNALYKKIESGLGDRYDVTCSAKVLVEVSPKDDNKGAALKYIAGYFGIPLLSSVAIGDNLNDLSMIEAAGVGVAVGNGDPILKSAADYVSVTNDECAVAEIIEKFGFKQYYV